ncbi:2-deoxy-D-gluconate 3-dehydrogenase [Methylobacterium sp. Leaf456]|uniref:SDR family NAD(P)-dependent oxidoreductase n=1 Tax=Methylobacterium sp. Leaf456 TaxID=1736382 RepID=UPI0006F73B41|nr:SDR family NAD(P)-dependent oxidoreductase [Methylobacterium sp. Leaf456]KQT58470.1 2-deoxy-D-gluconate 3-dehydrogenase [Methylobacterium sp. Leaf456]
MSGLFDLTGRHVLVTGASSGLGRHFAGTLARAGAKLSLGARRAEALAETVAQVEAAGGEAHAIVMDVTDAGSIERALDAAEERFGPVAVLINNAGVTVTKPALELTEAEWDGVIDTNLKGVWLAAQASARRMVKHRTGGSIVNIASILGLRVAGAVAPYTVSKAGVVQLTQALALEWARHRIRVNALAPGYIQTELNDDFFESEAGKALMKRVPQRRLGAAGELDGPLLLLASEAGSYMTGSVVAVDGGHLVSSL